MRYACLLIGCLALALAGTGGIATDEAREPAAEAQKAGEPGKIPKDWAYHAPKRPDLPAVKNKDWDRNEIDLFILARLEQEGLKPSAEADRVTLIRRLSLDLIGLPPTPEEVDA